MKRLLAVLLVLICWNPLVQLSAQEKVKPEDGKLAAYFKEYLEEVFQMRPSEATMLGDHRFDHMLDDVSPEARAKWLKHWEFKLADLPRQISYKKLSRDGQIDFEILQHHLKEKIWLAKNTRPFEDDPRVYSQYITDSVYLLFTQSTQPKAVVVQKAAQRISYIPEVVKAAKASLKNAAKVKVDTAIQQTRGAITFYESGIFQLAGQTPALSDLKKATEPVVTSLKDYLKFLQSEVAPNAKGDWRIGKKKFDEKLQYELNAGITSKEVLDDAEAEFSRVVDEMYVISRQLWSKYYPGQPLPPQDKKGKQITIRKVLDSVSKQHGKGENLIRDAREGVSRIKAFIAKKDILRLPNPDRCNIIEMPEFQRGNSIAYLNPAPPLDPKASSIYAISPPPSSWTNERQQTFLEEYNEHMLQVLTIHEAYPGHYVQLEYSNRHPSFIRKILYSGVFAEGWAVYTEQVMLDQGFGDGSLELRLNQLKFYLRAVGNAILDYKMHCTDITDEEAIRFLIEEVFQSEAEAILKVIRAKQSSCQLSTYFVGRMAFVRLRMHFQNELGDDFDLGRYHEAVLDHGTLPVRYLPELVARRLKRPR